MATDFRFETGYFYSSFFSSLFQNANEKE